jgi:hypothetical protein
MPKPNALSANALKQAREKLSPLKFIAHIFVATCFFAYAFWVVSFPFLFDTERTPGMSVSITNKPTLVKGDAHDFNQLLAQSREVKDGHFPLRDINSYEGKENGYSFILAQISLSALFSSVPWLITNSTLLFYCLSMSMAYATTGVIIYALFLLIDFNIPRAFLFSIFVTFFSYNTYKLPQLFDRILSFVI